MRTAYTTPKRLNFVVTQNKVNGKVRKTKHQKPEFGHTVYKKTCKNVHYHSNLVVN